MSSTTTSMTGNMKNNVTGFSQSSKVFPCVKGTYACQTATASTFVTTSNRMPAPTPYPEHTSPLSDWQLASYYGGFMEVSFSTAPLAPLAPLAPPPTL